MKNILSLVKKYNIQDFIEEFSEDLKSIPDFEAIEFLFNSFIKRTENTIIPFDIEYIKYFIQKEAKFFNPIEYQKNKDSLESYHIVKKTKSGYMVCWN